MKRKRVYISIPISGHDLEEVKEKARKAKIWVSHRYDAITPFDVCPEPDKPYSYYMGRTSKLYLSAMPSIYVKDGSTQKVVWQSSRWQESMVKK